MCSAREKLRQVGSELDTTYEELRDTRSRLGKAIIEKQVAEVTELDTRLRNMCLARNADFSNFCMIGSLMVSFVLCGLFVYVCQ